MNQSIKLTPICMGDLKVADSSVKPPTTSKLYTPPNKRTPLPPLEMKPLDFSTESFPSLGNTASPSSSKLGGFKQKVLDLIAKDLMDEAERNKEPEMNPLKMTAEQRIEAGWAVLPTRKRRDAMTDAKVHTE